MEKSPHVLLASRGAEEFARVEGCEIVDTSYFYTPERWQQLMRARAADTGTAAARADLRASRIYGTGEADEKFGTVGCVALDKYGNLAAGTSTGGMTTSYTTA
jgi:beta-aspartyl-peptidase (threonine type)